MVRKIKAKIVLQLRAEGLSVRAIAASQGMSRKSITAMLEAADAAGIGWDDVADRSDGEVYGLLFPGRGEHESVFAQADWDRVHRELARVGVTLKLLHGEYADACAASGEPAMGYDRFCRTYQHHVLITGAASRVGHKARSLRTACVVVGAADVAAVLDGLLARWTVPGGLVLFGGQDRL